MATGPTGGLKSYLQFIFIKDLDEVYEDELSEALKIRQKESLKTTEMEA